MRSAFLIPETTVHENGQGPVIDLGLPAPASILVTLGIREVVEQESLAIDIFSSADAESWSASPVLSIPQKFYAGVSSLLLSLSTHPEARFLRAQWRVNRWGRGGMTPLLSLYLFAEPVDEAVLAPSSATPG
jgi:hypothetical protein